VESYQVQERKGLNRNFGEGIDAPVDVYGLLPSRAGGWVADKGTSFKSFILSSVGLFTIAGSDSYGMMGLHNGFGGNRRYALVLPNLTTSHLTPDSSVYADTDPAFLERVGMQKEYYYHILRSDNGAATGDTLSSSGFGRTPLSLQAGGELEASTTYLVYHVMCIKTQGGTYVKFIYRDNPVTTATDKTIRVNYSAIPADSFVEIFIAKLDTANRQLPVYAGKLSASGNLDISVLPIGETFGSTDVDVMFFSPAVPPKQYLGRYWGVALRAHDGAFAFESSSAYKAIGSKPNTLIYSNYGYVNMFSPFNYEVLSLPLSEGITALSPTSDNSFGEFGGLLIFGDNECLVATGLPLTDSFRVKRYPATVGCDKRVSPATIGPVTFVVWRGSVYAVSGGEAKRISEPIDLPGESAVSLAACPQRKSLMVRMSTGKIFEYHTEYGLWTRPAISLDSIPIPNQLQQDGVIFVENTTTGDKSIFGFTPKTSQISSPAVNPFIELNVDAGDKFLRKLWRRVHISVGNSESEFRFGGFGGTSPDIRLYYDINEDDDFTGYVSMYPPNATRETLGIGGEFDELIGVFPQSKISTKARLRIEFRSMNFNDMVEYPILFEYIPRNTLR
jgi:hypothetical protein